MGYRLKSRMIELEFSDNGILEAVYVRKKNILTKQGHHLAICLNNFIYYDDRDFQYIQCVQNDRGIYFSYKLYDKLYLTVRYIKVEFGIGIEVDISGIPGAKGEVSWFEVRFAGLHFEGIDEDLFHAPGQGACYELTSGNINFTPCCSCRTMISFETKEDMYSSVPDKGAGLLGIEGKNDNAIAVTAWSETENFFPMTEAAESGLTLIQRQKICFDIARFKKIKTGTVYLWTEKWNTLLQRYQQFIVGECGFSSPEVPLWLTKGAILELHISQIGGFERAVEYLDKIYELGVRTLYLMPCLEYPNYMQDGTYIHGLRASGSIYSIIDYRKIDSLSGGAEAFKCFVRKAHEKGLRILFDLVPQGASIYGSLYKEKPEWFEYNDEGELFSSHGWNHTYSLDWANPEVQDFFVELACWYISEFDVDGFRIDAPHWKEPNKDKNLSWHASTTCFGSVRLIRKLFEKTKKIKPDIGLLCEVWGVIFENITHMQCEYNVHWALYHAALGVFSGKSLQKWLSEYLYTQVPESRKAVFLETHDTQLLTPMALPMRGSVVTEALMAIITFMGYTPMIWYEELHRRFDFYKKMLKIRMEYIDEKRQPDMEIAYCDSEHVFVAAHHDTRIELLLLNFYRTCVHAKFLYSGGFDVDADGRYELYNIYEGKPMMLLKENDQGKLEKYTKICGKDLNGLYMDLFPYEIYWLELRKTEE